jgi:hypothetical protein
MAMLKKQLITFGIITSILFAWSWAWCGFTLSWVGLPTVMSLTVATTSLVFAIFNLIPAILLFLPERYPHLFGKTKTPGAATAPLRVTFGWFLIFGFAVTIFLLLYDYDWH